MGSGTKRSSGLPSLSFQFSDMRFRIKWKQEVCKIEWSWLLCGISHHWLIHVLASFYLERWFDREQYNFLFLRVKFLFWPVPGLFLLWAWNTLCKIPIAQGPLFQSLIAKGRGKVPLLLPRWLLSTQFLRSECTMDKWIYWVLPHEGLRSRALNCGEWNTHSPRPCVTCIAMETNSNQIVTQWTTNTCNNCYKTRPEGKEYI